MIEKRPLLIIISLYFPWRDSPVLPPPYQTFSRYICSDRGLPTRFNYFNRSLANNKFFCNSNKKYVCTGLFTPETHNIILTVLCVCVCLYCCSCGFVYCVNPQQRTARSKNCLPIIYGSRGYFKHKSKKINPLFIFSH